MLNLSNMHIFMVLLLLILFGCNSDDNTNASLSNVIDTKHHNTQQQPDNHNQHNQDSHDTDFDINKLPKSQVLLTTSQTNALQQDFNKFELELTNIKFTVKPDGIDREVDIYMNIDHGGHTEPHQGIALDLTYLQSNHYLLLHEMAIPSGKITAMTLSFSGANSHIELPLSSSAPPTKTYVVDPFFSSYGDAKDDNQVHQQRTTPAELVIKTDIDLTQDNYQYINITIDKNMTAGLDAFFIPEDVATGAPKHQYLQFIPTADIQIIEKNASIPLIITSKKPLGDSPIYSSQLVSGIANLSKNHEANTRYAYISTTLKADDHPSIDTSSVTLFDTLDKLTDHAKGLYKTEKKISDDVYLNVRSTLNPRLHTVPRNKSGGYITNFTFLIGTGVKTDTSVVFEIPSKTDLDDPNFMGSKGHIEWQAGNILTASDPSKPTFNSIDPVDQLILPLNRLGQYTIINAGRVSSSFSMLPDSIHHFNNSTDFYEELRKKLYPGDGDKHYKIIMLNGKGKYKHFKDPKPSKFIVSDTMNIIVSGEFDITLEKWTSTLLAGLGVSLLAHSFIPEIENTIKDSISKGTLPFKSLPELVSYLKAQIEKIKNAHP